MAGDLQRIKVLALRLSTATTFFSSIVSLGANEHKQLTTMQTTAETTLCAVS